LAFLDVFPLVNGHVLVIPKKETDYIFDIDDAELASMMVFAKKVAKAQKLAISCKRIGIAVIGLEVPHAHIHLVPMNSVNDINFTQAKLKPSSEELTATAEKIRSKF
jgi:histidine triad (HIT) family protein